MPRFTVFTATWNRCTELARAYRSLGEQTLRDFEWLIVDDGSTDDTARVVETWQQEADFPIVYCHQPNRGKHAAFNRGVGRARGGLFLALDSDDACKPQALERFAHHWDAIPAGDRDAFCGVTALCEDQHGRLVGTPFPRDVLDSDSMEIRYRYRVRGEKWGFVRTDVLRRFPFPETGSAMYVPEGIVWNRIARSYRTRFVNERLRVYWIEGPSMVHHVSPARAAASGVMQHLDALDNDLGWFRVAPAALLRSALHYCRFSFHGQVPLARMLARPARPAARALCVLALAPAWLLYRRDRMRERQQEAA